MDANGTRFHLLLGEEDWGRCLQKEKGTAWNDVTKEVTLQSRLFRFVAARSDVAAPRDSRRGAAADRFGNIYWIDEDRRRIRVRSSGSGAASDFWPGQRDSAPPEHGDFTATDSAAPVVHELSGLAVTEDHYLVAGTTSPAGLLVFDLFSTGAPTWLLWPSAIRFQPFDMAARPGGGVWILDRQQQRYWGLDRHFRVLGRDQHTRVIESSREDTFQPAGGGPARGTPERRFPEGLTYDAASPLHGLDAFAIEALPDGTVLILDRNESQRFSRVLRYRFAQRLGEPVSLDSVAEQIEEGEGEGFTLVGHDFIYLPPADGEGERLIVASAEGNQAFAFSLSRATDQLGLKPVRSYLPLRRFGGKGLIVSGPLVHYDINETWVPLAVQERPRYATEAQIETRADGFDGGEPDCTWHRLVVDACIPPETQVRISSRAANSREELAISLWQLEPDLYRRGDGSELPWVAQRARYGSYELLFQRAQGRFLQLRLALTGNERVTPRLQALRAWYPRFSYAKNYLPAVYREDPDSGSFLERFLANVEGLYTALEDKIAAVRALFHWQSAPPEALAWLASWLDASLDPAWDERRRRLFIKHAVDFFQYRGTMHGVRMALALAFDSACDAVLGAPGVIPESRQPFRIVERFRTRLTPALALGEPLRNTGPRAVEAKARWEPGEGAGRLTERFRDFLKAAGVEAAEGATFTLVPPAPENKTAPHWQPFAQQTLGFIPSVGAERRNWQRFLAGEYGNDIGKLNADYGTGYREFTEVPLPSDMPPAGTPSAHWIEFAGLREAGAAAQERRQWQDFLARRYGQIAALNRVYRTSWTGFDLVSLFDRIPADGPALADWYQFETVVKVMHRHAHRFSVLIPSPGPNADLAQVQERLALARRVVELEKPAHTVFDVGFYWALFRVGEARLGFDTLIDLGSRALDLLPELILGRHFIGASQLAHPIVRPSDQRRSLECLPVTS